LKVSFLFNFDFCLSENSIFVSIRFRGVLKNRMPLREQIILPIGLMKKTAFKTLVLTILVTNFECQGHHRFAPETIEFPLSKTKPNGRWKSEP